ncbi:MAG: hypothetical protein JXA18_14180 [Chitinispirillaceae bacterium]|nr:hypothetical protein [Chitinispirillaceae bacterium]
MANFRKRPFFRGATAVFFAPLVLYFTLNPDFFSILLHEHVFHKTGSPINHIHTDLSLHVFFKHFSKANGKTVFKAREKLPSVTIDFYNTHHEFVNVFSWAFFPFLLLILLPFLRKRFPPHVVAFHARSPPAY